MRQFCVDNGFDPGNISRIERDVTPPPAGKKLEEYAKALGLAEGSDDWCDFFDRAAIARRELPQTLLDDQRILARLPIVFRTLRGQKVSEEQLDDLIELIRGT